MFRAIYDFKRFGYIHREFENSGLIDSKPGEIIPKTACFFSSDLDVYIDTSDGVNDDLEINEYCGRILACVNLSAGKKFVFFKSAYSPRWSKNIEKVAADNNGTVVPFFKWSFNPDFYQYTIANLDQLRSRVNNANPTLDLGLFADFNKKYTYPKPSINDPRVSFNDIDKFGLQGALGVERSLLRNYYQIDSREKILNLVADSNYTVYHGSLPYEDYMTKSLFCKAVLNPPGVGEYTSRMFDQTAVGNLVVLRKSSYDNGISWKKYIPEVDFSSDDWQDQLGVILENREEWRAKGVFYFDKIWSPSSIFRYFTDKISEVRDTA